MYSLALAMISEQQDIRKNAKSWKHRCSSNICKLGI